MKKRYKRTAGSALRLCSHLRRGYGGQAGQTSQPYQRFTFMGRDRSPSVPPSGSHSRKISKYFNIPRTFENKTDSTSLSYRVAFSLVEVILSMGILSVALLIIFAVLTPFLTQTGDVVETTTVNRITDRINAEVEQLNFTEVIAILNQNIGLFASRDGDRFVLANDPELETKLPERDRHYAISLSRNEDLSPAGKDGTRGFIAFQVKIERILHAPDGSRIESPLDHTLAIFNSAVTNNPI